MLLALLTSTLLAGCPAERAPAPSPDPQQRPRVDAAPTVTHPDADEPPGRDPFQSPSSVDASARAGPSTGSPHR
jgi:hypothetical protein